LNNRPRCDILLPDMATIDVSQLAIFAAVVRAGSFTGAARVLATQKAHVSRSVSRLERELGVQLLNRSTRSLAVTEIGRELYERATGILAALDDAQAAIQQAQRDPQGVLRITCGVDFGVLVVGGWITEFLRLHSQVRIEADFSNRVADVVHEGFDLAIRIGWLPDASGLSARKLGEITCALYAGPRYLEAHGWPVGMADLAGHDLVMFTPDLPAKWSLSNGAERAEITGPASLVANSNIVAGDAAVAGLGIVLLPRFQAKQHVLNGSLVEILQGWSPEPVPVHAVFPSSRYLSPKVRAFIDFARANMPAI
jgi:LysR family transcriptional regulator for bpeEF and oprC